MGKRQVSEKFLTKVDPDKGLRLQTPNGITTSAFKTIFCIKYLNTYVDAWVLEGTLLVLSVDKLVEENGFDLAWKSTTKKATLTKNGRTHSLTIQQGVPLLPVSK